jgi:hypothetical protein
VTGAEICAGNADAAQVPMQLHCGWSVASGADS